MVPPVRNVDPEWATAVGGTSRGDDQRLRIVIAGSRELPVGQAPRLLIRFLASLPIDAVVLLRSGLKEIGAFEQEVMGVCRVAHIAWQLCTPWPIQGDDERRTQEVSRGVPMPYLRPGIYVGREGVLHRDNVMVSLADLVLAFITPDEAESGGFRGTRHVVDAALAKDIPVFLYAVAKDGTVERVGEHDPDEAWTGRVPSPA